MSRTSRRASASVGPVENGQPTGGESPLPLIGPDGPNLEQRLVMLRAKVGNLQKQGEYFEEKADGQGQKRKQKLYDYHAADDVMAALRVEMDRLHLLSWVTIDEIVATTVHKFRYSEAYRTVLKLTIHIQNADKPDEQAQFPWAAVGVDGVDKDFVKATTLGHKYFWLYMMLIGDGGASDPDSTPYPEAGAEIQPRAAIAPDLGETRQREKSEPAVPDGLPPGFTKDWWESLLTMAQELPAKAFVPAPQFADKKIKARLSAHFVAAGSAEGAYKLMRDELRSLLPKDLFSDIPE